MNANVHLTRLWEASYRLTQWNATPKVHFGAEILPESCNHNWQQNLNYDCSSQIRIYLPNVWLYHHLYSFPGCLTSKAKHTWPPPKLWGFINSILQIINIVNMKTIQVFYLNVWWLPPPTFDLHQQHWGSSTQYGIPYMPGMRSITVRFLEKHWLLSVQHLTSNSGNYLHQKYHS